MIPLTITIHGEPGTGKTPVALTAPGRKLLLDVDGGSRFCALPRVEWDPRREPPPAEGDWELCAVNVRDWETVQAAVTYLTSGSHVFDSVILDPLTELQKRCREKIVAKAGNGKMTEAAWGTLLDDMERTLREIRDTITHPTAPVQCVVFVAQTAEVGGLWRPLVQGGLTKSLPALTDVVGYLYREDESTGAESARLLITPTPTHLAKDRTTSLPSGGLTALHGGVIPGPLSLETMLSTLGES